MQVDRAATFEPRQSPSPALRVLLPQLLPILPGWTQPGASRAELTRAQADRASRRERQREDALAAANSPMQPEAVAERAERKMLSGSRAARQAQLEARAEARAAADAQPGFRHVLHAVASGGGRAPTTPIARADSNAQAPEQPARSTMPDTPATRGTTSPDTHAANKHAEPPARPVAIIQAASAVADATRSASQSSNNGPLAERVAPGARVGAASALSAAQRPLPAADARSVVAENTAGAIRDRVELSSNRKAPVAQDTHQADERIARIMRLIIARLGREASVATLRLDPPELGMVRLNMHLRENRLALEVRTHTDAARRLLSDHVESLREQLQAAGISLERVEVRAVASAEDSPQGDAAQHEGPRDGQEGQAQADARSAGGGPERETESHPVAAPVFGTSDAIPGPAAESLVNVLA